MTSPRVQPLASVHLGLGILADAHGHEIQSGVHADIHPAFDIGSATAAPDGRLTTFAMEPMGEAGSVKPVPIGRLEGARVESYVWPTDLNPDTVGFDFDSGILALPITAYRDVDDIASGDLSLPGRIMKEAQ